ncbi:MAG: pyridoxamine 5'-phosphate oxidase family protein [Leptospiraceae bacterium]|nr:pyridoxamine 5'-phosphate oxidase family protein [Leptospiraceae bacterium]
MSEIQLDKEEKIRNELSSLASSLQTLQLATVDESGQPYASYAPFVREGDEGLVLYVHLSELARHCSNLNNNGKVSALLIEDESQCKTVFARKRITLEGKAEKLNKNSAEWESVMQHFEDRFGTFFTKSLRNLDDFHTFRLEFQAGTLVLGFGEAFRLEGKNLGQMGWLKGEHGKAGTGLAKV